MGCTLRYSWTTDERWSDLTTEGQPSYGPSKRGEDLEINGDTRYELQFEQGYRGCEELADFGRGLCPAAV